MFDAVARRSRWPSVALLGGALLAGVLLVPDRAERLALLAEGRNPLARPFAAERADAPYPESPLAVSLRVEAAMAPVDGPAALAFADALARELGFWLLSTTGAPDLAAAERALWASDDGADRFAVAWAVRLQDRQVYARTNTPGLWAGVAPEGPRYVHPDELPLLFLHVAWRLDLAAGLVRSPEHLYVVWRSPDGGRARGIEPTAFRRVDALGATVPSEEPSVGRRLVFPPEHFPSGVGGIRNPDPLPPGAYEGVDARALEGELVARAAARHDRGTAALERWLAEHPGEPLVARRLDALALEAGLRAWERGDLARVAEEHRRLAALRSAYPGLFPPGDERVLEAIVHLTAGETAEGLRLVRAVLAAHEPDGPVLLPRTDAHAAAMWLALEHGPVEEADWNRRMVPLFNRVRSTDPRFDHLCALGRRVVGARHGVLESRVAECAGR